MSRISQLVCSFTAIVLLFSASGSVIAENYAFEQEPTRHALVIGNENYTYMTKMPSARLDAEKIAEVLRSLNFTVTHVKDVPSVRFFEDDVLPNFRKAINPGDIVLVYFSGHGFTYSGHNYLVPLEMPLSPTTNQVATVAISVENVEDYFAARNPGLIVMLLDACRVISGFSIRDGQNAGDPNLLPKGFSDHKQSHMAVNTLVGFAARQGFAALGSAAPGAMSLYTASLASHLAKEGKEFGSIYNDVSVEVKVKSNEMQWPGFADWSDSELYFRPTSTVLEEQKEAWRVALGTNSRQDIYMFSQRFATSRYAAAARKWLDENPDGDIASAYTFASPAGVERAWESAGEKVAIIPSMPGFAFERTLKAGLSKPMDELPDRTLGVVLPRTPPIVRYAGKITPDVQKILAHKEVVVTKNTVAQSAPNAKSAVVSVVPAGTKVTVSGVESKSKEGTWLVANIPNQTKPVYIAVSPGASVSTPIELGKPLLEVLVPVRTTGIKDLVDPQVVNAAVEKLSAERRIITWVSISAASAEERDEAQARIARLNHVKYLLKNAGVDGKRITSVAAASDLSGGGVRVRFFGH